MIIIVKKPFEGERIYTIPISEAYKKAERRRAPYAVRLVKNFLRTHTKAEEIKLGAELNKEIWARGIKRPPKKVRVKAVKEGNVVKAELMGFEYKDFKAKPKTERKGMKEKLMSRLGPKAIKKEEEEKVVEGRAEKTEEKKQTDEKAAKEAM